MAKTSELKFCINELYQKGEELNPKQYILKNLMLLIIISLLVSLIGCTGNNKVETGNPKPFLTLNPPSDINSAKTLYDSGWVSSPPIPPKQRSDKEFNQLEKKLSWFHKAKYGLFFHFLAPEEDCTPQKWNKMVNAVDVEKFANQVKETGAGYVVLTLGQNQLYSCAPNPVLEKLWELKPDTYISDRDLPMEVYNALHKRGIKLMLYIATDTQYGLPSPPGFTRATDRFENWLKVVEWYSDHYGTCCLGWWTDGLDQDWTFDYRSRMHDALKHGNPDAIVASSSYGLSEFTHGHCDSDWEGQQRYRKPYYGRWDPTYKIQWHVLQYLGHYWATMDTAHSKKSIVAYAVDVVKGGGVITFDIGTCKMVNAKHTETLLEIPDGQMVQLLSVRDALKKIKASDGSGKKNILDF
jgi:hypothetical protein